MTTTTTTTTTTHAHTTLNDWFELGEHANTVYTLTFAAVGGSANDTRRAVFSTESDAYAAAAAELVRLTSSNVFGSTAPEIVAEAPEWGYRVTVESVDVHSIGTNWIV
jgi:hypothetical protein